MNLLEASHALAGSPTVTPASLLASRRGHQPFSTKLSDQQEDQRSPSSPRNPLQWLRTNIITPTRSTLGRVNVQPMVDSFRVARNRLSFGSSTLRASQRPTLLATHPTLTAVEEPEGELPAHEREPEDPCVTNLPLGSHTSKNPDKTADSLGSDMNPKGKPLGNPATTNPTNSANSLGSLFPTGEPSESPINKHISCPSTAALDEKFCKQRPAAAMQDPNNDNNQNAQILFDLMGTTNKKLGRKDPPALSAGKSFPPKSTRNETPALSPEKSFPPKSHPARPGGNAPVPSFKQQAV